MQLVPELSSESGVIQTLFSAGNKKSTNTSLLPLHLSGAVLGCFMLYLLRLHLLYITFCMKLFSNDCMYTLHGL
jgi:hypothetical protein